MMKNKSFCCPIQMVLILSMIAAGTLAQAGDKPNVVFILSDDQSWGDYGFMGHAHIETPNLDRLAAEGVETLKLAVDGEGLLPEAVRAVVEEFVSRDGTDYSPVEQRVNQVLEQLEAGRVELQRLAADFAGETRKQAFQLGGRCAHGFSAR